MNYRTMAVVAATIFAATMAMAQGFPPDDQGGPPGGGPPDMGAGQDMGMPGGQGMGPGQGRMGPPMGMGPGGMMGMNNPLMLLQRKDVQADLQLTDDQKTKVDDLAQKMRPQRRGGEGPGGPDGAGGPPPDMAGGQGGPGGGGDFDPAAMQKRMAERQKQVKAEIAKILTSDQQKRLKEIGVQLAGNNAILDEDVQKDLGVTDAQKASIKSLQQKQRDAGRSIMEKMRNGEIEPQDMFTLMQKNSKAMDTELGKLLSATQKEKLKTLAGAPFKADPQEQRGGFGMGGPGMGGPGGPGGGPGGPGGD